MTKEEIIKLVVTGITIGGAGTIIYQLKSLPKVIYSKVKQRLVYSVRIYQYDDLFLMLEDWFSVHHEKQYRDVEAGIDNDVSRTSDSTDRNILYKQEENTFVLKYKGKNLLVNKNKEKMDKAQSFRELYFRKYTISGIKAKGVINSLLLEVIEYNRKKNIKNSIRVYSSSSYGEWYSGIDVRVKPIDKTIINETKKSLIIEDLKRFESSEEWYTNVCIPYKRGYCFYGPPGTGKTTLALSIANYTKRNVYCINLNAFDDDSKLPICFQSISNNSILLIEDIDKIFSGRDNVKDTSKITFSSFLNCLDGAFYKHGLITIITTNHIEKLDEALLRTGRINVCIEIPKPSFREINEYYETFFSIPLNITGDFSLKMSDVQEICLKNMDCPEEARKELISKII